MAKKQRQSGGKVSSEALKVVPFNIRVSEAEKEAFSRAAQIAGVPLSAWTRERLRMAAMRELDNVGEVAPFFLAIRGVNDAGT
jgi:predicted HicB family RNase H-like nuclease